MNNASLCNDGCFGRLSSQSRETTVLKIMWEVWIMEGGQGQEEAAGG